jgi:hypothetical protein
MSVLDAEPKVPNDDNGRGLRVIGWTLLIWTGISLVWIPPRMWREHESYMPLVNAACFIGGLLFLAIGFMVGRREPSQTELAERTHELMANHEGHQNDDPATGNPPGEVRRIA